MKSDTYIRKILGQLHEMNGRMQRDQLGKYSVLLITGAKKSGSFLTSYFFKRYYYIYEHTGYFKMELHDLLDLLYIIRINTDRFFKRNRMWRAKGAVSVPFILSESGFTEEAIEKVENKKFVRWGEFVMPVLIDLAQSKFFTLKKYGFFARVAIKMDAAFLKKTFDFF